MGTYRPILILDSHGLNTRLNSLRLLFTSQPSITDNFRNHAVQSRGTVLPAGHHRLDPVMGVCSKNNEALVFLASLFHPRNWFALDLF